jgi:hypothetical protein
LAATLALKKLASSHMEASAAIDQFVMFFSMQKGLFGIPEARYSALHGNMSAGTYTVNAKITLLVFYIKVSCLMVVLLFIVADWWTSYGGQCKELQKLSKLIVSQCCSSSGCERNWSTFALVHTKLRNRIGYEKHKLVYVHYNVKLCIQQFETDFQSRQEKDIDPFSVMMDIALYDESNPIMEWLCNSMSGSMPTLDEFDEDDDDWTAPGTFLIEELQMQPKEVAAFKRKLCFDRKNGKKRKAGSDDEEGFVDDYESDSSSPGSPVYAESEESISDSDDDNGEFQLASYGNYCQQPVILFYF